MSGRNWLTLNPTGNSILGIVVLVTLVVVNAGYRSVNPDRSYNAWLLDAFEREVASHKQVVLVCIYESKFQWLPLPNHHHLDCQGTVVRSYKGDWRIGEPIRLHFELESAPKDWTPPIGYLQFLLLDEHSTDAIRVDTGENWDYRPDFDRRLQLLYCSGKTDMTGGRPFRIPSGERGG